MPGFDLELVYVEKPLANYIYLVREVESGAVAIVDPGFEAPVLAALEKKGWTPDLILLTHHHADHMGAADALRERFGARIIAPRGEEARIKIADEWVEEGSAVHIGKARGEVIEVPGHTAGHIAYYFADQDMLFCGDTLFSLGCGRLFEGTADQMWTSLSKLAVLPDETRICCAHEYTQANGRFALSIEPQNQALVDYMKRVDALRGENRPTIPSDMKTERACNPFLRPDSMDIRRSLDMEGADNVRVFAEIRARKDAF